MTMQRAAWFSVEPRSPLVFRTGLPFGEADASGGDDAFTMPRPVTLAGGMRAAWADAAGHFRRAGSPADRYEPHRRLLEGLSVHGGLAARVRSDGAVAPLAPAPADALVWRRPLDGTLQAAHLNPVAVEGTGCNLPDGLLPLWADAELDGTVDPDDAMEDAPAHWSWDLLCQWLSLPGEDGFQLDGGAVDSGFALDLRMHQQRGPRGASVDGTLHASAGIDGGPPEWASSSNREPAPRLALLARVAGRDEEFDPGKLDGAVRRLGADGRSARSRRVAERPRPGAGESQRFWRSTAPDECPGGLRKALDRCGAGDVIRLMLLTPAVFDGSGWRPTFLDRLGNIDGGQAMQWHGRLPDGGPLVGLVAAAVPRWSAHSGMATVFDEHGRRRGSARAVRRMVPEGAVYWLRLLEAPQDGYLLSSLWFRSLLADGQDARDGWGLAVPGLARRARGVIIGAPTP